MKTHKQAKKQKVTSLGDSFVIVPRKILHMLYQKNLEQQQQTAKVLLTLTAHVYFTDGYINWLGRTYKCKRGEYIGSVRQLEYLTGLTRRIVCTSLDLLESANFIECEKISRGKRIRFVAYTEFLQQFKAFRQEQPLDPELITEGLPSAEQLALVDEMYNLLTT